jgi:glycosyltransferase involved in cell wall biosynthesis
MLIKYYDIEIIGPILGNGVWSVIDVSKRVSLKGQKCDSLIQYIFSTNKTIKEITGDILYVSKPRLQNFGVGLLKKSIAKKPLVLDIDDWELGFLKDDYKQLSTTEKLGRIINPANLHNLYYLSMLLCEKLVHFANEITVSNRYLQKKFGGTIIWHARDEKLFDPGEYNKLKTREKYGIGPKEKIAMFLGTPGSHKGLENLIEAIKQVKYTTLIVVGLNKQDNYSLKVDALAKKMLAERYMGIELQPFDKAPEFLAIADVIVIPQKKSLAAIGQMPAKVFDAMAMAKPIIATAVCDLPEILNGCGWIVEPENPKQLSETIDYVMAHPEMQEEYGWKAREKFISNYNKKAMEKVLLSVFNKNF